jgi:hypothetical protein
MPRVFVLGAGANRAVKKDAPLNYQLLPFALKETDNPRVARVRAFIRSFYDAADLALLAKRNRLPPIEDILSQLDHLIAEDQSLSIAYPVQTLRQIREDLLYAICMILKKTIRRTNRDIVQDFVQQLDSSDSVIVLNYDLVVDNAVVRLGKSPNYGFEVRNKIVTAPNYRERHYGLGDFTLLGRSSKINLHR